MGLSPLHTPASWLLINLALTMGLLLAHDWIAHSYRRPMIRVRNILLPYLALLTGGISPRLMGLTGIDWLVSFGFGVGLITAILGLLVLVRSTIDLPDQFSVAEQAERHGRTATTVSLAPFVNAGIDQFYWSFLRGALWETFQLVPTWSTPSGYWAIWLAALVAIPEILRFQPSLPARLLKLLILLLTTILFIYTQNFWLCWLLHALILLLMFP